ncbi:MAG: glycosyltransferase family 2 protein [Chloroflexota bacterium]
MVFPSVTLIVAMRNEGAAIEACVASLLAQTWPADRLEILVMDGGSTDGCRETAERMLADRPNGHVLDNPGIVQAAGWNLGIDRATGDYVGIVSGHSELAPDYVESVVRVIEETGATMVGGPVTAEAEGPVGEAVAIATSTPFGVGGARHHYLRERAEVDTVFMGVARREDYARLRFNEEMVRNQDDELSYRILDEGGRIICDPAIRSTYRNRSTLQGLWRQQFAYGSWKVRVFRRWPMALVRPSVPAAGPWLAGSVPRRCSRLELGFAAVVASYVAADVAFSRDGFRRRGRGGACRRARVRRRQPTVPASAAASSSSTAASSRVARFARHC